MVVMIGLEPHTPNIPQSPGILQCLALDSRHGLYLT